MSFHNLGYLRNTFIVQANLSIWEWWSWSCTERGWDAYRTTDVTSSVQWGTNLPTVLEFVGTSTQTLGYNTTCNDGRVNIDVALAFQRLADDASATKVNLLLQASNETDNLGWKRFYSVEAPHAPVVVLTYDHRPTIATPIAPLSGAYVSEATPTLSGRSTDSDGNNVQLKFEIWNSAGTTLITSGNSPFVASGATASWTPSTVLTDGTGYKWRAAVWDGIAWAGVWSAWQTFTVDTTTPSAAPGVSSATYPSGVWSGGPGTAGSFTLSASGVTDISSYVYGLDQSPPVDVLNAATLGGTAVVSLTPTTDGPHTLYVRSRDRAGNLSPQMAYAFNVGQGAITAPKPGDVSAGVVNVQSLGQSATTEVTLQWRRGTADSWANVPVVDVTYAVGGGAVSAWPVSGTAGAFPAFNWNVEATVNAAEAGPDALDGPVQVRASFGGGVAATSSGLEFKLDRAKASAASENVGPGSVNLSTGNLTLSAADVSVKSYGSDLTVGRSFNTRSAADTDSSNMFGPGWVSSAVVADASAPYSTLTVTGSLVQVDVPDGSSIGFSKHDVGATTFDPEPGLEFLTLTHTTSPDEYVLSDLDGTVVTFSQVSGAPAGVYHPRQVTTAGSGQTTTLTWEKVTVGGVDVIRPTQMLAPVPSGVTCTTLVKGCRALTFTYATSTTATGTTPATWGDYLGRVSQISFTAWNPDGAPAAMATVALVKYAYDSNGRLREVWDPRLDWVDLSGTHHVDTVYDYDADGIVNAITPAGQQTWQLSYTTVPGDSGKGRLAAVTRSALSAGTAVTTVVYRVPVSGSGAPYDLSGTQTARWGQAGPPVEATAVFPPTQVPDGNQAAGTMPSSFERASVSYLDANGRTVNTVAPGGGTTAAWYDEFGHVVRDLGVANRLAALNASASDSASEEAAIAAVLSTVNTYSADGQELRDVLGPEHDVVLADESQVRGRAHTVTTFDQGAPGSGGPWHLPTTQVHSVQYTNAAGTVTDADSRTSTTGYDWTLRQATVSTVDPSGSNYSTRTTFDSGTGLVLSTTEPAGGVTTNTPATRTTVYYRAGTGSGYSECDSHAEWANLPCRVQPGGQAASGPELAVMVSTYDMFNQPRVVTEKISTGTLRTTTTVYDGAGRVSTVDVVGAGGTGTAVSKRQFVYDAATGANTRIQSLNASGAVTAENIRVYDSLGRLTSYTDADSNASTFTYDVASRQASVYDGKATRTFTYDGGSERRGLPTTVVDTQVGTFTGSYDVAGRLTSQTWPNGLVSAAEFDEVGSARGLSYTMPGCGASDCTLFAESVVDSVHGQRRLAGSTLSSQVYAYDAAGRLSTVRDTVGGQCTVRGYGFNTATDRTSSTSYAPASDGSCQTTTSTSRSWTYDTADRVNTAGYVYDSLGRTTTVPAVDTGTSAAGNLTVAYHVNDLARSLTQGTRTTTYTLDVNVERVRSWTDNVTGSAVTRTHHYAGDADSPVWTDEGSGVWSRVAGGLAGMAAVTTVSGSAAIDWQVSNLHGDVVATIHTSDVGLTTTNEASEYGGMRNSADIGTRRYGWLGTKQRAADMPTGVSLMGVRLYNPVLGRFLQVDPVYGGSASRYDYANQEPVNQFDLDGRAPFGMCWKPLSGATSRQEQQWRSCIAARAGLVPSVAKSSRAMAGCLKRAAGISGGVMLANLITNAIRFAQRMALRSIFGGWYGLVGLTVVACAFPGLNV